MQEEIFMDTKKYEVFEKTVALCSLTKAAQELGLTQSGVSHMIAAIEADLQLPLLKRTRTGARLSAEGEQLMPYIREIVRQEKLLRQAAAQLHSVLTGKIRVGTFTSVATHWLPAMMMQFQQAYPQVDFQLFNGDYHDIDTWLGSASVDVAFTTLPARAGCACTPLYDDALAAVLPKGHPLAQSPVCPVQALANEPFISLLEASNHDVRRAFHATGIRPNIRFETKDDYAVIAMVRQGLGVSIMPSLLLRGNTDGVEIRPIDPPASRTIALAVAAEKPGPAASCFAAFAEKWVKENG